VHPLWLPLGLPRPLAQHYSMCVIDQGKPVGQNGLMFAGGDCVRSDLFHCAGV
jgi:hypothetical protein